MMFTQAERRAGLLLLKEQATAAHGTIASDLHPYSRRLLEAHVEQADLQLLDMARNVRPSIVS